MSADGLGSLGGSPLGRPARVPEAYDAGLLYPVARAPQRAELGLHGALPFGGADRWTAWEATWTDERGRPRVAIATFDVPCTSPRLVESKSVKLWLASLAHVRLPSPDALRALLARDLAGAVGAEVDVAVHLPPAWPRLFARAEPQGLCLDDEQPSALPAAPDAALLQCADDVAEEALYTRAFRAVCPVTGQPDHADVVVTYRGRRLQRAGLYAYLIGFRRHAGFHEHCVERIFADVAAACRPQALRVEARFTRRGGLDINPVRVAGMAGGFSPPTLRQ
ncbi:MAG: NADPH-dependent 7-cyano-7-deazaguanine reductase [Betaproteobacteria bacterium]|nr:MAG: NADPH-dependent 7-cyano-7-deazaguanine reductase [Betaproteobacteria bacterium]